MRRTIYHVKVDKELNSDGIAPCKLIFFIQSDLYEILITNTIDTALSISIKFIPSLQKPSVMSVILQRENNVVNTPLF